MEITHPKLRGFRPGNVVGGACLLRLQSDRHRDEHSLVSQRNDPIVAKLQQVRSRAVSEITKRTSQQKLRCDIGHASKPDGP